MNYPASASHRSRWTALLIKSALGAAVAWGALAAGQAQALVVTVGGQNYDVTTFTDSYNNSKSKFAQPPAPGVMPWWGNQGLADAFATAVGSQLGKLNFDQFSPWFAYEEQAGPFVGSSAYDINSQILDGAGITPTLTSTWAQATLKPAAVPGPLPALGAVAAFGFSRKLRNRIKASKA